MLLGARQVSVITNQGLGAGARMEEMMRRFAWMGLVALAGIGGFACNDSLEGKEVFVATLSGAEDVPTDLQ